MGFAKSHHPIKKKNELQIRRTIRFRFDIIWAKNSFLTSYGNLYQCDFVDFLSLCMVTVKLMRFFNATF